MIVIIIMIMIIMTMIVIVMMMMMIMIIIAINMRLGAGQPRERRLPGESRRALPPDPPDMSCSMLGKLATPLCVCVCSTIC